MQQKPYKILISGGGTGGHIYPAIAIANGLKEQLPAADFLFVGAEGRMEMEKIPESGFKIIGLPIKGLQRKAIFKNLLLPFHVIRSLLKAGKIISDFKPDLAIGVGGYASGPVLYMAGKKKVPYVLQEQNSYAGLTNKILAKKAKKVFVAYDGMDKYFPKENIIFTGNPVRKNISGKNITKSQAAAFFGLDENKTIILSIGGSLGALTINKALYNNHDELLDKNLQLIWQTGKGFYPKAEKFNKKGLFVTDFIKEMDMAYAAADIIISRAGALSISELCMVGKAVVLVPSPNVAENHQYKNAMALVKKNAALLVEDHIAEEKLIKEVISLSENKAAQQSLSEASKTMAKENAVQDIVNNCIQILEKKDS
ncbi:MAG: undecaprenyldiphospho-muramoylpentapeptide beta-N-acetylglucosaminyltransferase [Chitinophagaceae bacterium]|nr:MAG: undecaprenyldiphospho-muramoylpentapeptide beta-N-acetylglucosaminyltransferase [Chitinophagaceae bacterium]